jgi:hypothetical protein
MNSEFTVGGVFSQSIDVFKANFPAMLVIGALAVLPDTLVEMMPENILANLLSSLLSFLFAFLLQGVVVYGVFQHLTGSKFSLGDSFGVAFGRLGYLILVSLVVGILSGIGFLFLIVPGVIIYLALWVAIPVTLVEKASLGESLQRSQDLTKGYRMRIFGLLIIMSILALLAILVYFGLQGLLEEGGMVPGFTYFLITFPVAVLTSGLATALQSVVVTSGYYALRRDKDGIGMEDLASIFE